MPDLNEMSRDVQNRARELKDSASRGVEQARQWMEPTGPRRVRPLFGKLPLLYLVPQDVHSVADYASAASCASPAFFAATTAAKTASIAIGASYAATSAMTDYRLSVVKLIPIEAHQVLDYVVGLTQIAAPFLFGYFKKDRVAAMTHIVTGAMVIGLSLVTDYRAAKGVGGRVVESALE
jgi:hypothetical protein